jgi:ketosteroid isomerase-like protein
MSDEKVNVVRAVIDGWLGGDPKTLELIAEDVVYVSPPDQPGGGVYRGHEGVLQWWVDWRAEWIDYELELELLEPVGDHVLSVERSRATGKRSGVRVDLESSSLWTLRDGKVIRWEGYASEADARRAAGLLA